MMSMLLSDSDCESYTASSDYEDQNDTESIYGGNAQSIFSSLEESIGKIDDLLAFERGFLHGDIVCSATNPSGQMGRVLDVDMTVDLESVSGEIIKDINSKKLLKFRSFSAGDYVVHGPWVGRLGRVVDIVTVLFEDGAKCEIMMKDPETLVPVSPNSLEDAQYPYYPGQHVRVRLSHVFKSARWLCGSWKANQDEGIVCRVEVGLLYVNWFASVMVGCNSGWTPPCKQDPKNLTLLSCFPHASWQLGDWCVLPVDDCLNHQMSMKEQVPLNASPQGLIEMDKKLGRRLQRTNPNHDQIYVIVKTKTKVNVLWQDGSQSIDLDSQTLAPVNNVGDHDFWPEHFVLEKAAYENVHVSRGQLLGIVVNVDAKERTVKVKWTNTDANQTTDSSNEFSEEIVSAYELIDHPDYSFCPGDVIFRLLPHSDSLEGTFPVTQTDSKSQSHEYQSVAKIGIDSLQPLGKDFVGKQNIAEDSEEYARGYLSCIGNVIHVKDGQIEVKWASGLTSKVWPHEIVGIDRNEDPASAAVLHDDNVSQGMPEYNQQSWHQKEKDVLEKDKGAGDDSSKDLWYTNAFFLPQTAIGFLTSVATSLFRSLGSTSLSGFTKSSPFNTLNNGYSVEFETSGSEEASKYGLLNWKELSESQILKTEELPEILDDLQISRQASLKQQELIEEDGESQFVDSIPRSGTFKQFDTVNDYSDHHFVNGSGNGPMISQVKRSWLRRVQQEWSILEKDLPGTIFVRAYEERIDLMRAAIVGAPGTPYHDGLFFFDIFLPPDYPNEPPIPNTKYSDYYQYFGHEYGMSTVEFVQNPPQSVHYYSGGLRLNPNLYESGRVCLSLLKTWTGTGDELWNPEKSTILQVLLSLQALVLNEKPYFNEAGYEKHIGRAEGEKSSTTYNENTFLLSCKSMLYVLHKPPKHFEALVEEHFQRRAHHFLLACKVYMDGAQVGCASASENFAGDAQSGSSTGFKIMLAKLFPKLVSGFAEKGIDCRQFLEEANGVLQAG